MNGLLAVFVAQLIDPVRIILAIVATLWAFKTFEQHKRFTPLSIAIIAIAALMSFVLSLMVPYTDANMAAISFVCGLFATGVLVGTAALVISRFIR
ncbi:hypothetical protein [Brucella tritici]|uniref:hypothetical protein n=1 Tax=Brucella tritici TaxID=94626 RepID=UPI0020011EE7|nr:hypothetical protein [Brucella tritici]